MSHLKPTSAILLDVLASGDATQLRRSRAMCRLGKSGRTGQSVGPRQQRQLLMLLPLEDAVPQVLKELSISQAAQLLLVLPVERASALVELFPSSEQADLVAELSDEAAPILASLSAETTRAGGGWNSTV